MTRSIADRWWTRTLKSNAILLARAAVTVAALGLMASCGVAPPHPDAQITRQELVEFRQTMVDYAGKADEYLNKIRQGKNVSDFTLGWFVYNILTEVSSIDDDLYIYLNRDDHDILHYLKTTFRDNPAGEIATLDAMAKQKNPTLRLIARFGLKSLRHIPDDDEPPDVQARDRRDLAAALAALKTRWRRRRPKCRSPGNIQSSPLYAGC